MKKDSLKRRKGSRGPRGMPVHFCAKCVFLGISVLLLLYGWSILSMNPWEKHNSVLKTPGNFNAVSSPRPSRRFPLFGTPEFTQKCPWVIQTHNNKFDCIVFIQPRKGGNEGIAEWVDLIAKGFIYATLKGCQLVLNYGPIVDVSQVLSPVSPRWNWTVPQNAECIQSQILICTPPHKIEFHRLDVNKTKDSNVVEHKEYMTTPSYRHAFKNYEGFHLHKRKFVKLSQMLPGFDLESGFACIMESLFQPARPHASQFQPDLFSRLLPVLRNPNHLVLALYVRTGRSDFMARAEKEGPDFVERTSATRVSPKYMECVKQIEHNFLLQEGTTKYERVIWLLISDSVPLKNTTMTEYQGQESSTGIPRDVITTSSRGMHTRGARNPSTADFAEGVLDWYLMGETDAVITTAAAYSFGTTAALRTMTPIYDCNTRSPNASAPMTWIYD
eukprot:scaffold40990_cov56-Attheya_sp.AAC.2